MNKLGLDKFEGHDVDLSSLKTRGRTNKDCGQRPAEPAPLIDTRFTRAPADRVVKDSFTFPPAEHAQLEELVNKALRSGRRLGKSAILRAGLKLLADLDDTRFAAALAGIEEVRRGPRKG